MRKGHEIMKVKAKNSNEDFEVYKIQRNLQLRLTCLLIFAFSRDIARAFWLAVDGILGQFLL